MNHAIYSPERVNKIVLLGPMGIPSSTLKVVFCLTSLLIPTDSKKERMVKWTLGGNPLAIEAFAEYMQIAMNSRSQSAMPMKISNKKLKSFKAPALLFLGGNDGPIGDAEKAANRSQTYIAGGLDTNACVRNIIVPYQKYSCNFWQKIDFFRREIEVSSFPDTSCTGFPLRSNKFQVSHRILRTSNNRQRT